ncbi:hypothetical protein ABIE50_004978 [Chitinophaga sp. OAE865]
MPPIRLRNEAPAGVKCSSQQASAFMLSGCMEEGTPDEEIFIYQAEGNKLLTTL